MPATFPDFLPDIRRRLLVPDEEPESLLVRRRWHNGLEAAGLDPARYDPAAIPWFRRRPVLVEEDESYTPVWPRWRPGDPAESIGVELLSWRRRPLPREVEAEEQAPVPRIRFLPPPVTLPESLPWHHRPAASAEDLEEPGAVRRRGPVIGPSDSDQRSWRHRPAAVEDLEEPAASLRARWRTGLTTTEPYGPDQVGWHRRPTPAAEDLEPESKPRSRWSDSTTPPVPVVVIETLGWHRRAAGASEDPDTEAAPRRWRTSLVSIIDLAGLDAIGWRHRRTVAEPEPESETPARSRWQPASLVTETLGWHRPPRPALEAEEDQAAAVRRTGWLWPYVAVSVPGPFVWDVLAIGFAGFEAGAISAG